MLRILPALAVLALLAPAPASAAPFGELPLESVKGPAICLRATGAPGELLRQNQTTAPFLTAGPAGLIAGGVLPTDGAQDCVAAAGWPGGGGVLAFPVSLDDETWVRGFLREPGQSWGEAIDILPPERRTSLSSVTLAASQRGDALVATSSIDRRLRQRILVSRRAPGGGFGAPERLAFDRKAGSGYADLRAGLSASGEAVVTWTAISPLEEDAAGLWAAVAPPGAPFGPPQRLARMDVRTPFALAVGADGRALAIITSAGRLVASERAPGGAFGSATVIAPRADPLGSSPVAVLRPGGGAVVAWTSPTTAGLTVRTREQAGRFEAPIDLVYPKKLDRASMRVQERSVLSGLRDLARAVATTDGQVMITWPHFRRRDGIYRVVPGVAVIGFAGASYEVYGLNGGLRELGEITPVVLADGSSAVAWTDNDASGEHGRVHLARDGSPELAGPAPPKVTFSPRTRSLSRSEPLILRVTCAAACDVYAQLADQPDSKAAVSLPAAGSRRLVLEPVDRHLVPRGGKVRVLVRSSAPGASRVTARTLTLKLRRVKVVHR